MDEIWTVAAREMVAYFGREAAGVAARRAAELARRGDWRGADRALLVLSGVERLCPPPELGPERGMERGMDHA